MKKNNLKPHDQFIDEQFGVNRTTKRNKFEIGLTYFPFIFFLSKKEINHSTK